MVGHSMKKKFSKLYDYFKANGFFSTSRKITYYLVQKVMLYSLPYSNYGDKIYSFFTFLLIHHRLPNSNMFNDFLYKIKTSDEILSPLRSFVTDKEFLKLYVKAKVGDEYNVPTIAVLSSYPEFLEYEMPDACCIKPTHASGLVVFKRPGEILDKESFNHWFNLNYYYRGREVNYKYLHPKIIIEPIIFDNTNNLDYKFFCYNGNVKFLQVDIDRHTNHTRIFFDDQWRELDFSVIYPKSKKLISKPNNFSEMIQVASRLSSHFSFARVDLYSDGVNIFVGEITNVPENMSGVFIPRDAEEEFSKILFS